MENLAHASDSFDFLVWTMPCAILHPQAIPGFLQTIHLLLERRYSIHINKVHLPSYGFPHDITYIVLLASPVCSAPRSVWGEFTQKTVNDVIGDLSFRNTRVDNNHKRAGAFVCIKASNPTSPESRNGLTSTIYNHNTGQPPLQGTQQVDFNSTALKIAANYPFGILNLLHPSKSTSAANVLLTMCLFKSYGKLVETSSRSGSWHEFTVSPMILFSIITNQCSIRS